MTGILDTILQGVLLGGLYALFAAGLALIFGVMRLVNLAHGDLIVLAAYLILLLANALHLGVIIGFLVALPLMFAVGYVLQAGLLNRVVGADILAPLLTTFGLSIILQNAMLTGFSADSRRLTSDGIETASLPLFNGLAIGVMPLMTFLAAVGVIVALNQLFYRTALGRAFRAVSDDPVTARLMGIDDKQLFAIAMGVALVVCTIAALVSRPARQFRSDDRAGAADLRLRGGHHRRPRQSVGHAGGRRHPRASRRRSAPRSIPNGNCWRAISPFSSSSPPRRAACFLARWIDDGDDAHSAPLCHPDANEGLDDRRALLWRSLIVVLAARRSSPGAA